MGKRRLISKFRVKESFTNYYYNKVAFISKVKKYFKVGLVSKTYLRLRFGLRATEQLVGLRRQVVSQVYMRRRIFYCLFILNNQFDRLLYLSKLVDSIKCGRLLISCGCVLINNKVVFSFRRLVSQYDLVSLNYAALCLVRVLLKLKQQLFYKKRRLLYFYHKQKNFLVQYTCFTRSIPPYLVCDFGYGFFIYVLPFFFQISKYLFKTVSRFLF